MKISIREIEKSEEVSSELASLYDAESWSASGRSSVNSIKKALHSSYCAYGAFDGEKLVGFFRALSDGVSDAYLLDLVIDKNFRKQGIASKLTDAIIQRLKRDGIEWIVAISTPEAPKVYAKFGTVMKDHVPFRF